MNRRNFLMSTAALAAGPAIVKANNIMRIKPVVVAETDYEKFMRVLHGQMAKGLNLNAEQLAFNYNNTRYSSMRAASVALAKNYNKQIIAQRGIISSVQHALH